MRSTLSRKRKVSVKKNSKLTTTLAVASLIIAFASAYFAYNQVEESRKQTSQMIHQSEKILEYYRLSTVPQINTYLEQRWQLNVNVGLYIENNGAGPAIIKNITVKLNGKTYDLTNHEDKQKLQAAITGLMGMQSVAFTDTTSGDILVQIKSFKKGSYIKSGGESIFIVAFLSKKNEEVFNKFKKVLEQMKIAIEYVSIYGEKFYR